MYAKVAVLVVLPLVALNANAAPAPAPGIFDDIGSLFGDATSAVASKFGEATSDIASGFNAATSIAGSVVASARASETATSLLADVTSIIGTETQSAYATIITANGVPVVEVTSVNGPAITIATQSGITTSFAGHVFTAAPAPSSSASASQSSSSAAPTQSHSSAAGISSGISKGMLMSAVTVVGSMLAGAFIL